jgi:cytochrome P450
MRVLLDEASGDPLSPPRPVPPYHDQSQEAWVLSRYADVLAAFREPRLSAEGGRTEDRPEISDAAFKLRIRTEITAALSAAKLAEWQATIEPSARDLVQRLPCDRAVDIIEEFAQPLCLATALLVTGADPADAERLQRLARAVSLATANPDDAALESYGKAANEELEHSFQNGSFPMGGPAFVGISQGLPCFLANAWLALIREPAELVRLRSDPDLMPRAMEELLRFAGLARKFSRHAVAPVRLGNIMIEEGERVILMLASANRDPEQFPDPDRLDLTRRVAGHVAFGVGPHSCVGASLLRMAGAAATRVFVERFAAYRAEDPVQWNGGSGFRCAASLPVVLRSVAA